MTVYTKFLTPPGWASLPDAQASLEFHHGLAMNANRAFAMLALINLTEWGMPLMGQGHIPAWADHRDIPYFYLQSRLHSDETSIRFTDPSWSPRSITACGYLISNSLSHLNDQIKMSTDEALSVDLCTLRQSKANEPECFDSFTFLLGTGTQTFDCKMQDFFLI